MLGCYCLKCFVFTIWYFPTALIKARIFFCFSLKVEEESSRPTEQDSDDDDDDSEDDDDVQVTIGDIKAAPAYGLVEFQYLYPELKFSGGRGGGDGWGGGGNLQDRRIRSLESLGLYLRDRIQNEKRLEWKWDHGFIFYCFIWTKHKEKMYLFSFMSGI